MTSYTHRYGYACCPHCKSEFDLANADGFYHLPCCSPSKSKRTLSNRRTRTAEVVQSPWLDTTKPNLFRDEFRLIAEAKIRPVFLEWGPYYTPLELYQWIYDQNGVDIFFRGLARYAPMFPLVAYNGEIAVWTSPPPSGLGNAIYMVMGHDGNGTLRLVGGNYFSRPKRREGPPVKSTLFFHDFDHADQYRRRHFIAETIEKSILIEDVAVVLSVSAGCEEMHTMAVYIAVLTKNAPLFSAGKAVIEGTKPADFSYEFLGEIT